MTVRELKAFIADKPDDMGVLNWDHDLAEYVDPSLSEEHIVDSGDPKYPYANAEWGVGVGKESKPFIVIR